jgi:hypothetical protein
MTSTPVPEIGVRPIAELHTIEMSIHTIFKEFPHDQYRIKQPKELEPIRCNCKKKVLSPILGACIVNRSGALLH